MSSYGNGSTDHSCIVFVVHSAAQEIIIKCCIFSSHICRMVSWCIAMAVHITRSIIEQTVKCIWWVHRICLAGHSFVLTGTCIAMAMHYKTLLHIGESYLQYQIPNSWAAKCTIAKCWNVMVVAVQNVIIQCFHVVFELISIQFKQHSPVYMANVLSCLQISNHSYHFFYSSENTYITICPLMVMGPQIIVALCSLCTQLHKKL